MEKTETVLEMLHDLGFEATRSDAERIVMAMSAQPTASTTQGSLAVSPASSDAPAAHVALARTRDAKIIAQEQATGTRSA